MKWVYFIAAVLVFTHFIRAFTTTLLIIQAGKINSYPSWVNVLFVWILPYLWIYKVRKDIRKQRVIVTSYEINDENIFNDFYAHPMDSE